MGGLVAVAGRQEKGWEMLWSKSVNEGLCGSLECVGGGESCFSA